MEFVGAKNMIMSVADKRKTAGLASVVAGQTAISTVGKEGLGLTYRGYAIEDLAQQASFEEVAHLLIYEELPTQSQAGEYQCRLMGLRDLPDPLREILGWIPASAHPMDVLRTGCSALGCLEPERRQADQEKIADRLLASLPSMLLDWHHYQPPPTSESISAPTQPSLAGHFLELLHGKPPEDRHRQALNVSLILYAEHEFNASTFAARIAASTLSDFYSAVTAAIGTLRGRLHGGANEAALDLIRCFARPRRRRGGHPRSPGLESEDHGLWAPRLSRVRSAEPRDRALGRAPGRHSRTPAAVRRRPPIVDVMWREKQILSQRRFLQCPALSLSRHSAVVVYAAVRARAH